ncbi:MazG protein [Vibrio cholerae CT 5369-93]|nr:MazG protein [Vibrio cholerae CT 5369-93]
MALSKATQICAPFSRCEDKARAKNKPLHAFTLAELDGFWDEVKLEEKQAIKSFS